VTLPADVALLGVFDGIAIFSFFAHIGSFFSKAANMMLLVVGGGVGKFLRKIFSLVVVVGVRKLPLVVQPVHI
jgi:hypothetical protein